MAQDEGVTLVVEGIREVDGCSYRPPTLEWCDLPKARCVPGHEGISWVPGRVTEDDDAGRALLAAFALNRPTNSEADAFPVFAVDSDYTMAVP